MTTARHGSATIDVSADGVATIVRAFDAPMSLVFDALTKPEHVRMWYSADGVPLHACEIDLRVGGNYHFAWYVNGMECAFRGSFMEIAPPARIVRTWVFEGRPEADAIETISLREENGVTTMTEQFVFRDPASGNATFGGDDTEGVQSSYDHLGELLDDLLS